MQTESRDVPRPPHSRISKEYHEALRDLMKQALHEDQDDIFEDYTNKKGE
jgi:hypothetical protein